MEKDILYLFEHIDVFMLILVRFVGLSIFLPILSGSNVPARVRIMFSVSVSIVIFSSGVVEFSGYSGGVIGFVVLIIGEFVIGAIISFVVFALFSILHFIGQMVDFSIGFSMVNVFDPMSQTQVPITGNLFYLLICSIFISAGGFRNLIYSVGKSFEIIPLGGGGAGIVTNSVMIKYVLSIMANYFEVGVKFALPIVGVIIVVDITLGLLTKAVPQMNVFVVGMPVKLMVGLFVIYMILPSFDYVYSTIYEDMTKYVMNVMRSMAVKD